MDSLSPPMCRVRELGDASVPFQFDVHGIIYSENAPELENQLTIAGNQLSNSTLPNFQQISSHLPLRFNHHNNHLLVYSLKININPPILIHLFLFKQHLPQ